MQDKISALIDGELPANELDGLLTQLAQSPDNRKAWRDYQLISDAIANQQAAPVSIDFMQRFSDRLEREPIVVAPAALRRQRPKLPKRHLVAMSMAASIALVSATAWYVNRSAIPGAMPNETVITVAKASRPASSVSADTVSPYLAAHQSLVGGFSTARRPVILTGAEAEATQRGQIPRH